MTQVEKVLKILREARGKPVSSGEILRQTMITRTPARIHELKAMGFNIQGAGFDDHGFKRYRLIEEICV